ncbi:MAG: long-chain fatty acid--CoA ligase [Anaerolineaceae bacterium]|nr:long-chain fatty acid--CoA ligase [Anaerolineaceae bacterium]
MVIEFLMDVFGESNQREAIIWKDQAYTYSWLRERVLYWQEQIRDREIPHGSVVILEADFSPNAVALFLALIEVRCILVPLTRSVEMKKKEFIEIAQGEIQFSIDDFDVTTISVLENQASHPLYEKIRTQDHPGLILFSSGSTGKSKAALHDLTGLLEKFKTRRFAQRSISFLLYDHIGGVNTMLHILSNGGTLITVQDRSPDAVLGAVEKYQAELLPTSPTFINLILLSEAYKRHDLSSLKTVTYGTEPMPESTLKRFHELFPEIKLQQTYGLSEVGILRSKSLGSDTLWVKIGGEGFETRVVDNILQIRAQSAMLGYLNAPSPFTEDGWFITGDEVEVDGEYMRILGRRSELINVGGEKVYPAEVESVIQAIPNVEEVSVYGEKNPITGSMVCAMVKLQQPEDEQQAKLRIKQACAANLPRYKVPVRITFTQDEQHSERFKKMRPR